MDIKFSCTVLSQDLARDSQEVEYKADGYETILVGTPVPPAGTNLNSFFRSYAPLAAWKDKGPIVTSEVTVGYTITLDPLPPAVADPEATSAKPTVNTPESELPEISAVADAKVPEIPKT